MGFTKETAGNRKGKVSRRKDIDMFAIREERRRLYGTTDRFQIKRIIREREKITKPLEQHEPMDVITQCQDSPFYFTNCMFGLVPQPLKPEYQTQFDIGLLLKGKDWSDFCAKIKPYMFEPYEEDKHITWQQSLVFYGIEKALRGEIPNRISIVSGHGIGKSCMVSIVILWFLFSYPDSQVPCTAPTASGLYDVLWKEISKWIAKMPKEYGELYIWEAGHIRMRNNPQVWFARAKTSSKENTEALAGVHADWVLVAVDEASGVEEPIFETMEGALTSGNILVFLIGNGTRSLGYFYDTHHKDAERWQTYSFDSEESPRVNTKYIEDIISKYGSDSLQYAIRVKGKFPNEGIMDDSGYVQLFNEKDIHLIPQNPDWKPVGSVKGSLDASGEGQDASAWAVRDRAICAVVAQEKVSNPASMAIKSLTVIEKYQIDPSNFVVDNFGEGANVGMEMALLTLKHKNPIRITPVNIGDKCEDENDNDMYINIRAMIYHKFMLWCRAGGEIMETPKIKQQLLSIRFKRTGSGKIQIMDKVAMKKLGYASPDEADAMSMTFLKRDKMYSDNQYQRQDDFDSSTVV